MLDADLRVNTKIYWRHLDTKFPNIYFSLFLLQKWT